MIRFCKYCSEHPSPINKTGFFPYNIYETCSICGSKFEYIDISIEEYAIIVNVSTDLEFIQAMVNLKEKDPIEYQLKIQQFKTQLQLQKSKEQNSKIFCPNCHSKDIQSISALNRGVSIAMLGIFSKKINKCFECKSCGYTW